LADEDPSQKAETRSGGLKVRTRVARRAKRLTLKLRRREEENTMNQRIAEAVRSAPSCFARRRVRFKARVKRHNTDKSFKNLLRLQLQKGIYSHEHRRR
jgi:glutamate-1-semialdehyde aminotransferase